VRIADRLHRERPTERKRESFTQLIPGLYKVFEEHLVRGGREIVQIKARDKRRIRRTFSVK
jgi:hypothetical protein